MEDRRYQILVSKHVLILKLPALLILRELVEHRTDQRRTVLGSFLIKITDVIVHGDPDVIIFLHDPVILLAVAPELVGLAGVEVSAAPVAVIQGRNVVGASIAVHTENCGVNGKLIPANQKLLEIRIVHIVGHEAADIGGPPWDSRKAHVQACLKLIVESLKGAGHIAGPDHISVFLASGPGAAKQVYDSSVA